METTQLIGTARGTEGPPRSLEKSGRLLIGKLEAACGSVMRCAVQQDRGGALNEQTGHELVAMAELLLGEVRSLVAGLAAPGGRPEAKQRRAPRPTAAARPRPPKIVEKTEAPPQVSPVAPARDVELLPKPAPTPESAAVAGADDEIDALCADYEPAPLPSPGLVVPLPATYRDDPHFRLRDALVLGASGPTPQSGTLGRLYPGRPRVGLNLNESFCLSTFSVPGGGKSYLCNNILQMVLAPLRYLNELPRPRCAVSFHYHPGSGYEPEVLAALQPNQNVREVLDLIEDYGALPQGLSDVVLLVPRAQVAQMRRRYPQVRVFPILFSPDELGTEGWQALLGINDDNDGTIYARRLRLELAALRGELSLASLSQRLQAADLSEQTRAIIQARLDFVQPFLSERYPLARLLKPGRLIIVDVRDAWVPKKEALTLLSLVTSALGRKETAAGGLLFCFDEAHRYLGSRVLRAEMERLIRERRHLGLSVLLASQDPLSVPAELIGLSDLIALGKIQSEEWLRRIIKANGAFKMVKTHMTARMGQGKMLVWAERLHTEAVDRDQLLPVNLLQVRPMAAHHGGATHSAVR